MEISNLGNGTGGQKLSTDAASDSSGKNTNSTTGSLETPNSVSEESQSSLVPPPEPTGQLRSEGNTLQTVETQSGHQVNLTI